MGRFEIEPSSKKARFPIKSISFNQLNFGYDKTSILAYTTAALLRSNKYEIFL